MFKLLSNTPLFLNIIPAYYVSRYDIHLSLVNQLNCYRSSLGKVRRKYFTRMFPTVLVYSDGSSINIRYHEPQKIIKLPADVTMLTEEQKQKRLERRKPKSKVVIEGDIEDNFSLDEYQHLWKK